MARPERERWYDDACATAHALDLVGERWALLVVRELMFGPKRFGELRASLPGLSANILTQRLESLEAHGIVVRRKLPPPASVQAYDLTDWGRESEPIFQALGRWAARSPTHDPRLRFGANSLLLSLRTMLDADAARGLDARIRLVIGEETFLAHIADGQIAIARDAGGEADLVLIGASDILGALVFGGVPVAALEADGALVVEGDRALAERLASLFPLPTKASLPPSVEKKA